jgi:ACS family hexuronate transporter-like MFS transporter
LATSLFNAGTKAGALLAPALIPWMAYRWGWQSTFLLAAAAGMVWLVAWLWYYRTPEQEARSLAGSFQQGQRPPSTQPSAGEESEQKMPWLQLLRYRQTWSFILGKFLTDPVWWFFLIWLPDFFRQTRGLEIKRSWVHLVVIYSIITVLSIGGGWVTGWLASRGWTVTRARKTGMFCFALCVVPILFVTRVGDWSAVLLIGLAGAAHQAWSANLYTTVSDMFPKPAVASVIGIGGMAGSAGAFFFPILTGKLLDHFAKQENLTAGYAILFGICSCIYLLAFAVNHLCAPRFEPLTQTPAGSRS